MESAGYGNVPTLPDNVLDVRNVTLLRRDVMHFRTQHLRQCKCHRGFTCSRWTDKNPRGLVRIRRKFTENALRFVQANEISNSAWAVFLCQWHGKWKGC